MADPTPPPSDMEDRIAKARAAGYSWDDIQTEMAPRIAKAKAAGYTDEEIHSAMGFQDQKPMNDQLGRQAEVGAAAAPPKEATNAGEAFAAAIESTSGGYMWRDKAPAYTMPKDPTLAQHLAGMAGGFLGETPAAVVGGVLGFAAGSELPVVGNIGGAMAGGMALPAIIRETYANNLKNGRITSVTDFAEREALAWGSAAKGAATGLATAAGGSETAFQLGKLGAPALATSIARTAAELGIMTNVSSALEGHLAKPEDYIDGAVSLALMHAGAKAAEAVTPTLSSGWVTIRDNLVDHWAKTGEPPQIATAKAMTDPVFRAKMQANPAPEVPSDSSATPHEGDEFVLGKMPQPTYQAFHGTASDFSGYDVKLAGKSTFAKDADGVTFFSSDPDVAAGYANFAAKAPGETSTETKSKIELENASKAQGTELQAGQNVRPVDLSFKNPSVVDWENKMYSQTGFAKAIREAQAAGHDGVVFKNVDDNVSGSPKVSDVYASFKPNEQAVATHEAAVKASQAAQQEAHDRITNGNGTSDDAWATVASHQADVSAKPPWVSNAKDWWNTFYREFIRKDSPLEPIYAAAEKGTKLPSMDDPRTWMRLQELSNIRSKYMVEHKMIDLKGNVVGPGLNEIVEPFNGEKGPKNFWTYAVSRWAVEKAAQEKETGVEIDAAHQVAQEGAPKYEAAFQKLMTFQNQSLKYLADGGVLSQEAYDAIIEENKARIPGYRVGKGEKGMGAGQGLRTFQSVKAFFGSDDQIKNVQESILRDTFLRTELANRNKAKLNVTATAEDAGLAHKDTMSMPKKFELTPAEMDSFGMDAANSEEDLTAAIWRRVGKKMSDSQVPVFEDGKLQAYSFDDPAIYKFLNGLDTHTQSTVAKLMAKVTKATRASIVLNPAFPLHIAEYDLPFQAIMKGRFTPADFATGAKTVVGRLLGSKDAEDRYEAALRNGALAKVYGSLQGNAYIRDMVAGNEDPAFHTRVWNAVKTPYDMLRAWGQNINDMQKLGRFERGQNEGEEPLEAGLRARGAAYHDPYVGGNLTLGNNRTIMFLGAYVNGMDQTLRAALGKGTTTTGDKLSASRFWTRGAAIITLPMLASWALNKDKEWYKGAPEWQKERGLLFHVGPDSAGHTFFYPMPQLLSFIFGTVPLMAAKAVFEQDPHAFDRFGSDFAESFVPSSGAMLYSLATPLVEHVTNHSFWRNKPLASQDSMNQTLAPEQYTNYSSGTAKTLSKVVNDWPIVKNFGLSPPVIDNYIAGLTGFFGTASTRIKDLISADENKPSTPVTEWPGISSFFARYPSASAQPTQDFMNRLDTYNQIHGSLIKSLEAGDMERFKQLVDENPAAASMHAFQLRGINAATVTPENAALAQTILQSAMQKNGKSMPDMQMIFQVEQGLKILRAYTKLVYDPQTPQITGAINQIQQQMAPGSPPVKGKLSPNDKTQLLDQAYAWMQQMSEHGNSAMDQAGFK